MTLTAHVGTKDKVLQVIAAHGFPIRDIDELRELWGPFPPNPRELTRILWDLQKQGEVKFQEIKAGRDSLLTKIRLSRGISTAVFRTNESRGRHPIGVDLTDPSAHSHIARGGPIERTHIMKETPVTETYPHGRDAQPGSDWTKYVNGIKPDRVRPILPLIAQHVDRPVLIQKETGYSSPRITTLVTRGVELGWITKEKIEPGPGIKPGVRLHLTDEGRRLADEPFIDDRSEAQKSRYGSKASASIASDTPTQYPNTDTPVGYSGDLYLPTEPATTEPDTIAPATMSTAQWPRIIDVVELEKYPLISDLMTKETRLAAYEQAAALLEGFDQDLALTLLEKIQLSALEKEVIAFVRSLR